MKTAFNLKQFRGETSSPRNKLAAMSGVYLVEPTDIEQVIKECVSLKSGLRDLINSWVVGDPKAVRNDLTDEVYMIENDELFKVNHRGQRQSIVSPQNLRDLQYTRYDKSF